MSDKLPLGYIIKDIQPKLKGQKTLTISVTKIEHIAEDLAKLKRNLESKKTDGKKVVNTDVTDITILQNDLKCAWRLLVKRFRIPADRIYHVERLKEQIERVLSVNGTRPFKLNGDIEQRVCKGIGFGKFRIASEVDCQSVFRSVAPDKTMAIW